MRYLETRFKRNSKRLIVPFYVHDIVYHTAVSLQLCNYKSISSLLRTKGSWSLLTSQYTHICHIRKRAPILQLTIFRTKDHSIPPVV